MLGPHRGPEQLEKDKHRNTVKTELQLLSVYELHGIRGGEEKAKDRESSEINIQAVLEVEN